MTILSFLQTQLLTSQYGAFKRNQWDMWDVKGLAFGWWVHTVCADDVL